MVSVPESQGPESQGPQSQVPISPYIFDDGSDLAGARKTWIQRRFFAVFLASSLIFHLSLIALVALFDPRLDAPHTKEVEIPVELIDEKQIQNEQSKSRSGQPPPAAETPQNQKSEKAASSEPKSEPEKQVSPAKLKEEPKPEADKPQGQLDKPPVPADAEPKPPEPNSAEMAKTATKALEAKPAETKPAVPQPQAAAQPAPRSKPEPEKAEPAKPSVAKAVDPKPLKEEAFKTEAKPPIAASPQQAAPEHEPSPPPAQNALDQSRQTAQNLAAVPSSSQLPLFYRSNDQLSLAIPAPLPTNDESAEPLSYKVIVFSKLERFKEYPKSAIARHAVGEVSVFFSIDDTGQPQDISMLQSSGEEDLDAEALAIISRAAPYPIPPEGAQRDFAVTIGFNSRFGSTP
jgi:TonB family protein